VNGISRRISPPGSFLPAIIAAAIAAAVHCCHNIITAGAAATGTTLPAASSPEIQLPGHRNLKHRCRGAVPAGTVHGISSLAHFVQAASGS